MTGTIERLNAALANRYRVERELGAGGMATVYVAHDVRHDRHVAIKVLHEELAAALGAERFLTEIRTTARLQHPHVLPLLDSGDAGGLLYYVMPLVTGESLRDRLVREKLLPIDVALRIARQAADALGHAHAHGIIHRDIKPENILLQDGHALVADFGIALAVQTAGSQRMTQTGLSLGTPQYMAPEQAMGEKQIDARADLYALGAVVYEMLTGEPPFTGATVQAIVAKVMTERPVAPSTIRDTVPSGVEAAVLKALAKLPADRFATASEFVRALDAPGAVATKPSAMRRSRRRTVAVTAAVAGVTLVLGWTLGRAGRKSLSLPSSVSVMLPDSTPLEPTHFNSEGATTFDLARDGSALVFVGKKGRTTQLYVRRLATFDIRPLDGTDGASFPFFSPHGDAVAFFVGDRLMTVSLTDGHVSKITDGLLEVFGGAWAPDGRFILSSARASALQVRSATGDSLKSTACVRSCALPELLPDGRHVLTSGSGTGIGVIDLETGETRRLRRWQGTSEDDGVRGSMARYDGDGHLVWVGTNGDVVAARFDPDRVELIGPSVILAQGARVETGRGAAQFALSRNGTFAFAPGPLMSVGIVVIADRSGRLDTVKTPAANYARFDMAPDGRRILAKVMQTDGTQGVVVMDAVTGQTTPWVTTARRIRSAGWEPNAKTAWYELEGAAFRGDPTLVTPPDSVPVVLGTDYKPLPDGKRFLHFRTDTLLLEPVDQAGTALRMPSVNGFSGTVTDDSRWFVDQETVGRSSALVARSLDGSNRRIIVSNNPEFSMVWSTPGASEVIVAINGLATSAAQGDIADEQSFWSIPYTPGAEQPFGAPKLLFRASVADFPGRNYGVGLKGQRFVFKQHIASQLPQEIRLIQNWHALLDASSKAGSR